MASFAKRNKPLVDPDPIVIDLLINLAATGIAGLLVKLIKVALQRYGRSSGSISQFSGIVEGIEDQINRIKKLVDSAMILVEPGAKRELGGILLLRPNQIQEYHRIRDTLFDEVKKLDEISMELDKGFEKGLSLQGTKEGKPTEFKKEISYIETRLRDARVASLSEHAFLDIKSSLDAMRQIIKSMREGYR